MKDSPFNEIDEMPDLHGDELVLPLLHLLLEWFDVGRAVHRLRLQDVVVQHHLQQEDHMIKHLHKNDKNRRKDRNTTRKVQYAYYHQRSTHSR